MALIRSNLLIKGIINMPSYNFDVNNPTGRHIVSAILTLAFYSKLDAKSEPDKVVKNYWKIFDLLGQENLKPDTKKK